MSGEKRGKLSRAAILRLILCLVAGGMAGMLAGLSHTQWLQLGLVFVAALVGVYAGFQIWKARKVRGG